MKDLHKLSALEIQKAFVSKEVSAIEIATFFLRRIEKYNPSLGAFLAALEPRVLLKAESLDQKRAKNEPLGKLAAVPIGVKDNIHIAHEITTAGSQFLKNYKAPFSASVIEFLEEEDALCIGKTNLDEFAMGSSNENSSFFPVKNPWNQNFVPGGSSGGSAAAVAARLCPIALGTDTGGSIRQPASFCGTIGFKPTYGRVSRYGLVAFGSSLDQIGPLTHSVSDAALVMEVIGRHCKKDATSLDLPQESYPLLEKLEKDTVIGVPWRFLESLPQEIKASFEKSVSLMKDLGAKIIDVNLDCLSRSIATYYILATAEASTNLARFDGIRYGARSPNAQSLEEIYEKSRKEGFGKEVKKRIMLGTYVLSAGYQDAFYKKAQKVRSLIIDAFDVAFQECDVVMMPTAPSAAFELNSIQDPLQMYLQDIFTIPSNLAGLPTISVPSGKNGQGLPLGVQFLGAQMCDVSVMQIAYAYERAASPVEIPGGYE